MLSWLQLNSSRGSHPAGRQPGRGARRLGPEPPLNPPQLAVPHLRGGCAVTLRRVLGVGGALLQRRTVRTLPEPVQLARVPCHDRWLRRPDGHLDRVDSALLSSYLLLLPQGDLPQLLMAPSVVCRSGAEPRHVPR